MPPLSYSLFLTLYLTPSSSSLIHTFSLILSSALCYTFYSTRSYFIPFHSMLSIFHSFIYLVFFLPSPVSRIRRIFGENRKIEIITVIAYSFERCDRSRRIFIVYLTVCHLTVSSHYKNELKRFYLHIFSFLSFPSLYLYISLSLNPTISLSVQLLVLYFLFPLIYIHFPFS